jgi:hypothetical protein
VQVNDFLERPFEDREVKPAFVLEQVGRGRDERGAALSAASRRSLAGIHPAYFAPPSRPTAAADDSHAGRREALRQGRPDADLPDAETGKSSDGHRERWLDGSCQVLTRLVR